MQEALRRFLTIASLAIAPFLAACEGPRTFVMTPNLMAGQDPEFIWGNTHPDFQTGDIPILYVTDRGRVKEKEVGFYNWKREKGLAYGVARIEMQPFVSWERLLELSTTQSRDDDYRLSVESVEELGSLSGRRDLTRVDHDRLVYIDDYEVKQTTEYAAFNETMKYWLDRSDRREAFVFVHGFNNSFTDGIYRIAEIWHYLGRQGVPIAYSWPAGRGGLTGYAYDRESGEFTVLHLKQFLRALIGSTARVGQLMLSIFEAPKLMPTLAGLPRLQFIDCTVKGFSTTHNYCFANPASLSDLLLVLRDGARPGTPQRPLVALDPGVWRIDNQYLRPTLEQQKRGERLLESHAHPANDLRTGEPFVHPEDQAVAEPASSSPRTAPNGDGEPPPS